MLSRRIGAFPALTLALVLSLARSSAAQQGMGGTGGSGTGGSGTGGSGTGGSGTGGSGTGGSGGSTLDDPGATCTSAPHGECADRCPSFATCFVSGNMGSGRLYYRVDEQRFDCAGLDCAAANVDLGDYCCERGEFAPDDDGGGCALAFGIPIAGGEPAGAGAWLGIGLGLWGASVLYRRRRGRRSD